MLNIYQTEKEKIEEIGIVMQRKWKYLTDYKLNTRNSKTQQNAKLMQEWAEEVRKRYLEIGFKVTVDITPALANVSPPVITINERIVQQLTDHERIAHEIVKENK